MNDADCQPLRFNLKSLFLLTTAGGLLTAVVLRIPEVAGLLIALGVLGLAGYLFILAAAKIEWRNWLVVDLFAAIVGIFGTTLICLAAAFAVGLVSVVLFDIGITQNR